MDQETRALITEVAEQSAASAVNGTLVGLGVDVEEPLEVQKDMAALRELRELMSNPDFQKDMLHIRKWRKTMEGVQTKGILTFIALLLTGVGAVLVVGLQSMFGRH